MESFTHDTFFDGNVVLSQPKYGYRFSIDAVLLSHLAIEQPGNTVLDLGTGCGVIPILLAHRCPDHKISGVEIQPELADLALLNVEANKMTSRIDIVKKNMTNLVPVDVNGTVDLIVTNPPYRKLGSGRINKDSQKAIARHELSVNIETVLITARRLLNKSGRFCIIYPSTRVIDLVSAMRSTGLEPKFLTMIHSNAISPARLVAITGVKDGRPGIETSPSLYLYHEDGTYTSIVEAMFSGRIYSKRVFITNPDLTLG